MYYSNIPLDQQCRKCLQFFFLNIISVSARINLVQQRQLFLLGKKMRKNRKEEDKRHCIASMGARWHNAAAVNVNFETPHAQINSNLTVQSSLHGCQHQKAKAKEASKILQLSLCSHSPTQTRPLSTSNLQSHWLFTQH